MGALRARHQVRLGGELPHQGQGAHPKASPRAGVHLLYTRAQEMGDSTTIRTRSGCIINWGQDPLRLITTLLSILVAPEGPTTWVLEGVHMTLRASIKTLQPLDHRDLHPCTGSGLGHRLLLLEALRDLLVSETDLPQPTSHLDPIQDLKDSKLQGPRYHHLRAVQEVLKNHRDNFHMS